jgi:tetrahydromethanopterin S-methyltransferase subunit B
MMADPRFSSNLLATISEFEDVPSLRFLQDKIDRLPISADAKSLLLDLASLTLEVGGKALAFGRKLIVFILEVANKFQNVIFGVIVALILSAVLASIPLLGPAIGALLTPIMVALGISRGAVEDFRNISVQREIDALKQRMAILATGA